MNLQESRASAGGDSSAQGRRSIMATIDKPPSFDESILNSFVAMGTRKFSDAKGRASDIDT
jgi:hypothetical protein